jgi:superfamily II DNA or RNA helicase
VRSEVVSVPSGEAEPLADVFPMLRPRLDPTQRQLLLQPCAELRVDRFTDYGRIGDDREIVLEPEAVHYRDELEPKRLLHLLSGKLGLGLTEVDIDAVLRNLDARRVKDLRASIRNAVDDPARLLLSVGEEGLRTRMPLSTLEAVVAAEGDLDARGIAELALVVYATRVLQDHADLIEERGLEPPQRWSGSRAAVTFVRDLGFPKEFAGFEARSLERLLEVEGPPQIGGLHDYQEVVVEEIRARVRGEDGLRGLLSLPTGAGKTRVTIEALIDAMEVGELQSPILWVAQTEELCEQAVETWSELWRWKGPQRRLTISRLRASFEADQAEHGDQVVVATIAKLDAGVFEKTSYKWLSRAGCIVVDEAHSSIGPSYTRLLEWQGMSRNRERAPLIGLTATPFRGTNIEEGKRLVARYGNRRLDFAALGGEDAYPHLQRDGILSEVDHELLPGSEIRLSSEELDTLQRLRRLPDRATQRLAGDVDRNRTLLDSIAALDPEWPVLLFATSVEHAHTMAALLTRAGISAAAISADTERSVRRHYVEQFRQQKLRVLTNYNVLAAGFDAPKVRALYIARPTYSPNVYQQMIGRGLRGPRNGGTQRCLLVNVADNVAQFGERLAFHEFDYLWDSQTASTT